MKILPYLFSLTVLFLATSCDVDQTREAKLPDVDVDVDTKAGQMPAFDIEWADVDVRTTTKTVEVPKLVVVMEEEEIEVPVIDVDMPEEDGIAKVERNITVQTEVTGQAAKLDIQEIYATDNILYVISTLEKMDDEIGDQKMRLSDQVVLNAREDLDVRHYIIGEKPARDFNNNYYFVNNRSALNVKLKNGKKIYSAS